MSSINASTTAESANNAATTSITANWKDIPCVQYGFAEGEGPKRAPKLRTIFEPIPKGAETTSPVYILTPDQFERQQKLSSGYATSGDKSIAFELQEECEHDSRVLYPIHIETDSYHSESPETMFEWFRTFVEKYLNVSFDCCTLYFSGSRSIHVHVPRFISSKADLAELKTIAETYCKQTQAEFDCGVFSRKGLFRIPGVTHTSTGLHKVGIKPDWDKTRIFREANTPDPTVPDSYQQVLRHVFTKDPEIRSTPSPEAVDYPYDLFHHLNGEKATLSFEPDRPEIETPLIEQREYPSKNSDVPQWAQYNTKEFSPYALSKGGSRSVAVVEVRGTPFAREEVTIGDREVPAHALIPSYFYGARGCAGGEFTKYDQHAPLQLSKADYGKWEYNIGDKVVIIGGQSRSSIIKKVTPWQATVIDHALTGENGSRQAALDYLESEGFDIGSAGASQSTTVSSTLGSTNSSYSVAVSTSDNQVTEAARLQQLAEDDGIQYLDYYDLRRVAHRLLRIRSWDQTWNWFETQFGDQFDPDDTRKKLIQIIEHRGDFNVTITPKCS